MGGLTAVPNNSSDLAHNCSCCGHIQDMPLKERVFNCGNCGVSIDRDLNASLNLEKQALVVA